MSFEELKLLLRTVESAEEIDAHREEIAKLIPKVRIMFDFDQKNYAHQYDLWMHCIHTVIGIPRDIGDDMLYLAALLHDIGKPDCQVAGKREDGVKSCLDTMLANNIRLDRKLCNVVMEHIGLDAEY